MPDKRDYLRMDPSTEQLIRDYLNRLAVAARSSMGPDELRAFLARTRDSIERQYGANGVASPAEAASVLAALGEPRALVELEHARLAAALADPGSAANVHAADGYYVYPPRSAARLSSARPSSASLSTADTDPQSAITGAWPGAPESAGQAAGRPGGRQRRFPGKPRRADRQRDGQQDVAGRPGRPGPDPGTGSALTPAQQAIQRRSVTARRKPAEILPGKPAARKAVVRPRGPQGRDSPILHPLKRGPATGQGLQITDSSQRPAQPDVAEQPSTSLVFVMEPQQDPRRGSVAVPKFYPVRAPAPPKPFRERGPAPAPFRPPGLSPAAPAGSPPERKPSPAGEPSPEREPSPQRGPEPMPADQVASGLPLPAAIGAASARSEWVSLGLTAFSMRAAAVARRQPLEFIAVIMLGLGGLIYPPVWLAGAVVALPSRLWDIKDKLAGLAVPAVLAVVGAVSLAVGSGQTSGDAYFHHALTIGGYLIRAGAVLGAAYLTWRVQRGPRQPAAPPWRRPYQ
jgi:hypothetical protein